MAIGKHASGAAFDGERALYPVEHTFVVQVARQDPPPAVAHAGRVENVLTGKSTRFSSQQELWDFVHSDSPTDPFHAPISESARSESAHPPNARAGKHTSTRRR